MSFSIATSSLGADIASKISPSPPAVKATITDSDVNPFAEDYLSIYYSGNFPRGMSQSILRPAYPHPGLSYLHTVSKDWLMGFGGQYKIFTRLDNGDELALLVLSHESYYGLRLQHPLYLLIGDKISYMLPTASASYPVQRVQDFNPEIGFAFSMVLTYLVGNDRILSLRTEAWRGTKSKNFQGQEIGVGYGFRL